MPTRISTLTATGSRVHLRAPQKSDAAAFLAAARASRALHGPWAKAPATRATFDAFVKRYGDGTETHAGFLVVRNDDGALVGVYNFSEIVRNAFQSAYLGYYAFTPQAGGGYMTEGLTLALDVAASLRTASRSTCNRRTAGRSRWSRGSASRARAIRAAT
jgi:ribosomal-protein-alanine N-acetyltransferase